MDGSDSLVSWLNAGFKRIFAYFLLCLCEFYAKPARFLLQGSFLQFERKPVCVFSIKSHFSRNKGVPVLAGIEIWNAWEIFFEGIFSKSMFLN